MSQSGQLALEYARLYKWHVFPIKANTKDRPLVKWGTEATSDRARIKAWWLKWPDANIGIATGPSKLCVVDLDNKNGKFGEFEFDLKYSGKLSDLSDCSVSTPSGGRHIYFIGSERTTTDLLPGVDIRSRGGYVLAPGSQIDSKTYEWLDGSPPSSADWHNNPEFFRLPASVKTLFKPTSSTRKEQDEDLNASLDHEADIHWAKRHLKQTIAKAEGDASDDQTFGIACELRNRGLSVQKTSELMAYEWEHPHEPDWVIEKVRNAYEYANGNQGSKSILRDFPDAPPSIAGVQKPFTMHGIRRLSLQELLELPPPSWQVEGLIPEGGLVVVYGQPKVGKTFFAIALSLCIATGRDFFGFATKQGKVTYIAAEGGPSRLKDRVRAFLKSADTAISTEGAWGLVARSVDIDDDKEVTELISKLGDTHDLVVIDTLARCMTGDENSQKDMSSFVAGCDRIRHETGATVVVVHHEGKDRSKGARGSTVLRGALDTAIRLRRSGHQIIASVEDQRDGAPGAPIALELATIPLGEIEDSSSALKLAKEGPNPRVQQVRDVASEMDGRNQSELAEALVERLIVSSTSSANRLIKQAIEVGSDNAVGHGDGYLWIEPISPGHPQKGLKVRYET